jgi:hypothetical protein
MNLKEVKREVDTLEDVSANIKNIQKHFIKPLNLKFLQSMSFDQRKELKQKIGLLNKDLKDIGIAQSINDRLRLQSRYLVEMKLTEFNGDKSRNKILQKQLLKDDVYNLSSTIVDVKEFGKQTSNIHSQYEQINSLLDKHLSLEDNLEYLELPHKIHFQNLIKTQQKQTKLVHKVGKEFIMMAKK